MTQRESSIVWLNAIDLGQKLNLAEQMVLTHKDAGSIPAWPSGFLNRNLIDRSRVRIPPFPF